MQDIEVDKIGDWWFIRWRFIENGTWFFLPDPHIKELGQQDFFIEHEDAELFIKDFLQ